MQSQLDAVWQKGAAFALDTVWSGTNKAAWRRLRWHVCQAVLIMPILVSPAICIADGMSKRHAPNSDEAMKIRDENAKVKIPPNFGMAVVAKKNERIPSFNADITKRSLRGRIAKCSTLIELAVDIADGNHSYGGICSYSESGKRTNVMICDDEMVGHFKMSEIHDRPVIQDLADFVLLNCTGG
jgi:hypothetical protein